jgi:hAT family C-terminal dimerisation region
MLSRLIALDGLSFRVLTTSKDLRQALLAYGFDKLPQYPNTIKRIVVECAEEKKQIIKLDIEKHIILGERFSSTFDEWSSTRNRRFLNIIVHGKHSEVASSSRTLNEIQSDKVLIKCIRQHLNLYENGGPRGSILTKVYEYLMLIRPTSIESERAFSSSGYICSKNRSRLNDSTLDQLCVLRSYFQNQNVTDLTS